jgi:uncharacterized repeat protein (TIGR03803 family)
MAVPFCRAILLGVASMIFFAGAPGGAAHASTFKVLHSFCAEANCTDGKSPEGPLALDASGNIYGTTFFGGKNGCGTIFELSPPARGSHWRHRILHSLCAGFTIKHGTLPVSRLIIDVSGNLYGTTFNGGKENAGVVFELSPNANHSKWTYREIADLCVRKFCGTNVSTQSYGLTYRGASSGVPYDGVSPLYGQNQLAGRYMLGALYALQPKSGGTHWSAKTIHDFCGKDGVCTEGSFPDNTLTFDASGNLFGAAYVGGANNVGTIFEFSPKSNGKWAPTVLHDFCQQPGCTDGEAPNSELLRDATGNLYGTAGSGGAFCPQSSVGCGVLFKLTPNGTQSSYGVLHGFCAEHGCPDGAWPAGPLAMDTSGAIYGVTGYNNGTIFRMDDAFHTLYSFCAQANCADGIHPGGLTIDGSGNLFGIAVGGGTHGEGTVFELSP